MNMSATMSAYNKAKKWALRSDLTDSGRVNRAFGILMKQGALERAVEKYETTIDFCICPDNEHSGKVCKHRVAMMMFGKHQQILNEEFGLELSERFE